MKRDYAETYKEYKSKKYKYTKGIGRLGCYQGLDYFETLLKNGKYYSEKLEDSFIFIESYINSIEQQVKKQKEAINKLDKYLHTRGIQQWSNGMHYRGLDGLQVQVLEDILNEVSE